MGTLCRWRVVLLWMVLLLALPGAAPPSRARQSVVLTAMEQELQRTWRDVKRDPEGPLYFLGYTITETRAEVMGAANGVVTQRGRRATACWM